MKRFVTFLLVAVLIIGMSLIVFRCVQAVEASSVANRPPFSASLWKRSLATTSRHEISDHCLARLLLGHDDRRGAVRLEVFGLGV